MKTVVEQVFAVIRAEVDASAEAGRARGLRGGDLGAACSAGAAWLKREGKVEELFAEIGERFMM